MITESQPALEIMPTGARSKLFVTPDLVVGDKRPIPNRWRRFWYWALLGWRWESVE